MNSSHATIRIIVSVGHVEVSTASNGPLREPGKIIPLRHLAHAEVATQPSASAPADLLRALPLVQDGRGLLGGIGARRRVLVGASSSAGPCWRASSLARPRRRILVGASSLLLLRQRILVGPSLSAHPRRRILVGASLSFPPRWPDLIGASSLSRPRSPILVGASS